MKILSFALCLLLLAGISAPASAEGVSGKWNRQFQLDINGQTLSFVLELKADGGKLTGTFCTATCGATDQKSDILDGKVDGNDSSFGYPTGFPDLPRLNFKGVVSGDASKFDVTGTAADCPSPNCITGEGSATRAK